MDYITADGWVSFATRIPGHPLKVYSQPNTGRRGVAGHSVVGAESEFQDGVPNRFLSDEREPGNPSRFTPYAAASSVFVGRQYGNTALVGEGFAELIQMYPLGTASWTSGGPEGNLEYVPIEEEGGGYFPDGRPNFSERFTAGQENTFIRLYTLLEAHYGWPKDRVMVTEHRHIAALFGYAATSCASGRYAPVVVRLAAGERYVDIDMKDFEDSLIAMFVGSEQRFTATGQPLTREEKLDLARYRMNEIVEGRAQSIADRATSAVELSKKALALVTAVAAAAGSAGAILVNIAT